MANIRELKQRRAAAKTAGAAAMAEHDKLSAKAERTEAEEARLAQLDAEIEAKYGEVEKLDAEIEREEKAQSRRAAFAPTPAAAPVPGQPARSAYGQNQVRDLDPVRTGGFRSLAEFAVVVRQHASGSGTDPRLAEMLAAPSTYNTSNGSSGEGFLVPIAYRQEIMEEMFEVGDFLNWFPAEPTSAPIVQFPRDETTPWGGANITAAYRAEGSAMTPQKTNVKAATVELNELAVLVAATEELLADAPRLGSRLGRRAGQAMRWKASDALMWGTGVGMPLGFMTGGSLVTVSKESGQTATTINKENVGKMYARLLDNRGAFWAANIDTMPQLLALTIGNQPAFVPMDQGYTQAPGGFLLGLPLRFTEHAKTLGALGDITLVQPRGYYHIRAAAEQPEYAESIHLWFDSNHRAFRWLWRHGGMPVLQAVVTPAQGANTRSHFIALEAR